MDRLAEGKRQAGPTAVSAEGGQAFPVIRQSISPAPICCPAEAHHDPQPRHVNRPDPLDLEKAK